MNQSPIIPPDEKLEWQASQSSQINRFAYIISKRKLTVEFKGGGTYDYFEVPQAIFEEFARAESHGKFLNAKIKPFYRFAKIELPKEDTAAPAAPEVLKMKIVFTALHYMQSTWNIRKATGQSNGTGLRLSESQLLIIEGYVKAECKIDFDPKPMRDFFMKVSINLWASNIAALITAA